MTGVGVLAKGFGMRRLLLVLALLLVAGCPAGEEDMRKGNVFFATGDLDRAQQHYEKARAADPNSVRAMSALGNVAFERKSYVDAIGWYEKALAKDEKEITTRHSLAIALSSVNRDADAQKVLERTVQLVKDDDFAFFALGGLLSRAGKKSEAEEMYIRALAVNGAYHAARYALAMLMIDDGRTEEAERELTRLVRDGQASLAAYGHARIAAKASRHEEAAKHLGEVLDAGVTRPEKIAADAAFTQSWGDPAMMAIRERIATATAAER